MAYDKNFPANDSFLADFPEKQRAQIEAIINDAIVNAKTVLGLQVGNDNGNIPIANGTECKNLNAGLLNGKTAGDMAPKIHAHDTATPSSNGFMSNVDKTKLNTIAENAQVNPNVFTNIKIGNLVLQPDAKDDTLEFVAGTNIVLVPDTTNDRVSIGVAGKIDSAANADYAQYLWSTTHKGTFFIYNAWDGTYWNFISNHGAPVRVGYADNAGMVSKYGIGIQRNLFENANLILSTGLYYCTSGLPSGINDANVYHHAHSDSYAHQMAFGFGPNYDNTIYSRIKNNGTWSAWRQLATTDKVLPITGGALTGDLHVPQLYNTGWYRSIGDTGWYSETHGGGWHMSDDTWIRAYNGKNVYTQGVFQADGGFNGNLHGTADFATLLNPLSGDANYKLGYTADGQRTNAGDWGRVVMRYAPNGQTYGVRTDRADYADNAGAVNGYSADALRNRTSGRNTPVLTPLIDWSQAQGVGTNSGAGLTGQGSGDIYLKQSYKNFDKILIHMIDGDANWTEQFLWEKWEIDYAMGNTYRWTLGRSGTGAIWIVWSSVNLGTQSHPLSTETCWKLQSNNCRIKEIYGLTY